MTKLACAYVFRSETFSNVPPNVNLNESPSNKHTIVLMIDYSNNLKTTLFII